MSLSQNLLGIRPYLHQYQCIEAEVLRLGSAVGKSVGTVVFSWIGPLVGDQFCLVIRRLIRHSKQFGE